LGQPLGLLRLSAQGYTTLSNGGAPTTGVPAVLLLTKETREPWLATPRTSCCWVVPSGQCIPGGRKGKEKGRNIKVRYLA